MPQLYESGPAKPKKRGKTDAKKAYRKKTQPYDRSPREYVKREAGPKKAAAVGRAVQSGNTASYKKVVRKATTKKEAAGAARQLERRVARTTIRRVTRAAISKGMPVKKGAGLGITKQEGGKAVRKAIKTLGYKGAQKTTQRTKRRLTGR